MPFLGMQMVLMNMFQALGKSIESLTVSLGRQGLFYYRRSLSLAVCGDLTVLICHAFRRYCHYMPGIRAVLADTEKVYFYREGVTGRASPHSSGQSKLFSVKKSCG